MRLIYLALVVFIVVLALGIVSVARSSDTSPRHVAANHGLALALPGLTRAGPQVMAVMSPREAAPVQFCGQCTADSDCGTGHKCCGPSSCLECFKVVTCP